MTNPVESQAWKAGVVSFHYVVCDWCQGGNDNHMSTKSVAIKRAKEDGWIVRDGLIICKHCQKEKET